jgi:hypothetical protein
MSNNIYCIHDNFRNCCQKCHNNSKGQYCRTCGNTTADHNEYCCPYKTHAAISSALRQRSCRALGCMDCQPGQTHYCNVCNDNDANHRSLNCPLRNSNIYCQVNVFVINPSQPIFEFYFN